MTITNAQPPAIGREATIKKILTALSGCDLSVLQKDQIITDLLEAQTPIPIEGEVEWATAVSDDPETIVVSKSEARARSDVDGWNSRRSVARGESSRGILYRRTVGPWEEVTV